MLLSCDAQPLPVGCLLGLRWFVVPPQTALVRLAHAAYVDDNETYAGVGGRDNADGRDDADERALARLDEVADKARDYAAHAKAPNTLKGYRGDWADWADFPSGAR